MSPEFSYLLSIDADSKNEADSMVDFLKKIRGLTIIVEPSNYLPAALPTGITLIEAAGIINCDPSSVHYLIRKKILPAEKIGRQWFLDSFAVHSYKRSARGLKSHKTKST